MGDIMTIVGDWTLVIMVVLGLAGSTMELLAKPFIQALVSKLEYAENFKKTDKYKYLIQFVMFGICILEGAPFVNGLDIFSALGANGVPQESGLIIAAILITFFSRQLHDVAAFINAWANRGSVDE